MTAAEAQVILAGVLKGVDAAILADFANVLTKTDPIAGLAEELIGVYYDRYTAAITAPINPASVEQALRIAERDAATLITNMQQSEIRKIGGRIANGLEKGQHPWKIAKALDEVKGLDAVRAGRYEKYREYLEESGFNDAEIEARLERFFQKELRDRKKTIAQTEARHATSEGARFSALDRGARYKTWMTTGDARVSDIDLANESAGVIGIDEPFPSGHMRPPSHPNCRCTVTYITSDEQAARAQRRAEERAAATAAAKEAGE